MPSQRPERVPHRSRRRLLSVGAVVCLPTAGCLGQSENEAATTTPEPDHPITLSNERDQPVDVTVKVILEATGETVYNETQQLAAGEQDRVVYNTRQAAPEGIQTFRIELTVEGETVTETVETSACYGEAVGTVTDDGPNLTYSIC